VSTHAGLVPHRPAARPGRLGRCGLRRASAGEQRRHAGLTLIELVITIVVLAPGLLGVLAMMSFATARSADPVLDTQGRAIAEAYLEEILLRAYADPDGSEAGESRATWDDVDDYDALAANGCTAVSAACPVLGACACNQFGEPFDALQDYLVAVDTVATTLNGAPAWRVDVAVTHARAPKLRITLSGFRTSY
jgi:MSHA pilin protein MshD